MPRLRCGRIFSAALIGLVLLCPPVRGQPVLFVDASATGADSGASWTDAFVELRDALVAARASGGTVTEIWVADGVYTPAGPGGPRSATFQLISGVAVFGGFDGGESSIEQRDPRANPTVLSGDLAGDDGQGPLDDDDNAYHVVTGSGTDASAVLDGFTITAGNAAGAPSSNPNGRGGGMFNDGGDPTIRRCLLRANAARFGGGGMYNVNGADPVIDGCVFIGNSVGLAAAGLGMFNENNSRPMIANTRFVGHTSDQFAFGGGMYNHASDPTLVNCVFSGNSVSIGAGLYNDGGSRPLLAQCSFGGNEATFALGGGILNTNGSSPTLVNCVLADNRDTSGTGASAQMHTTDGAPLVRYSCIEGLSGQLGGTGNVGADPGFVNVNGVDDVPGTLDDNLRLSPGSPCIDVGDNESVPPGVVRDLDGNPRFVDDPASPNTGNGVPPLVDMGAYEYQADCNDNGVRDDVDIANGTSIDCNDNVIPDQCEPDCNGNGVADECDLTAGTSDDINGNAVPDECDIVYVNAAATGTNDGSNWANAFTHLRDGLSDAVAFHDDVIAVWVAGGVYTPAPPAGSRDATFQLIDGIPIYGGFSGGENRLEQRDPVAHETILSGDLNGDDGPGFDAVADNVRHVVTGSGRGSAALVDGFTITGGNADGTGNAGRGAGMFNDGGSPTVQRCVFRNNLARLGGAGMYNVNNSHPSVNGCLFHGNTSNGPAAAGLGMLNQDGSSPTLVNCRFIGNSAPPGTFGLGGGVYNNFECNPLLVNCLFSGNTVHIGGALVNDRRCNATLVNCTFSGNRADNRGGAIFNTTASEPTLTNCILWGNVDAGGTDESAQIHSADGSPAVNYSIVQGLSGALGGVGNSGDDPQFVDPAGVDRIPGTPDDDPRLMPGSPAIDAGDNDALPAGTATDLTGSPRFVDDPATADTGNAGAPGPPIVDLGAFEFAGQAPLPDCDNDRDVDLFDFACFLSCVSGSGGGLGPDCDLFDNDRDVDVDLADFGSFQVAFTGP